MGRIVTKSIAIIGEGETMRIARRYPFKVAPDFPQHSDINHILKPVELRQYIGLKLLITTFFILVSKKLQKFSAIQELFVTSPSTNIVVVYN